MDRPGAGRADDRPRVPARDRPQLFLRHLRWRTVLLGLAAYVSTLPFSITFGRGGYEGLLIKDWPERIVVVAIAIVLWSTYWRLARRARLSGL